LQETKGNTGKARREAGHVVVFVVDGGIWRGAAGDRESK
jgi:hypothetical protein